MIQEFQFVVFNDMIVIWIVPSCLRHSFEPLCKCLPVVVRQQVLVSSSTGTDVTSRIVRMPHSHLAREAKRNVAQVVRFSFPGCAVVATRDVSGTALTRELLLSIEGYAVPHTSLGNVVSALERCTTVCTIPWRERAGGVLSAA